MKYPLELSICSWATGIGGGVARMESYYLKYFNPEIFKINFISLVPRDKPKNNFPDHISLHILPDKNKFYHLSQIIKSSDIVQFQGSFDPLVCDVAKYVKTPLLVEILHNIECGGLFENIDLSICVSESVRKIQQDKTKAKIIHNGVDLSTFKFEEERIRKSENKNKLIFLQVGNRSKLSYHLDEIAPELLKKFDNLEFWIAGREQNRQSSEHIKFFGVIENIESLYQGADYNILFSSNDSFGLSVAEGMACGCIPIVTSSGGFLDIISHNSDGYMLEEPSPDKILAFLENLILNHNPIEVKSLRKQCRIKVEDKFSIEKSIEKYENLYIEFLENKKFTKKTNIIIDEKVLPTGDAIIGECIYNIQTNNKDISFQNLDFLVKNNLKVLNVASISIACNLAQLAFLNNKYELAESVFRTLINQNSIHTTQILEKWHALMEKVDYNEIRVENLGKTIILSNPNELNLILDLVEKLLSRNKLDLSIKILELAKESTKTTADNKSKYNYWLSELKNKLPA